MLGIEDYIVDNGKECICCRMLWHFFPSLANAKNISVTASTVLLPKSKRVSFVKHDGIGGIFWLDSRLPPKYQFRPTWEPFADWLFDFFWKKDKISLYFTAETSCAMPKSKGKP